MIVTIKPYAGVTVKFDKTKHAFTVFDKKSPEGRKIESVTGATGKLDKSGALVGWAVKLFREFLYEKLREGVKITEEVVFDGSRQHAIRKDKGADIGTQVHDWISLFIKGKKPAVPKDAKIKNGVLAFLKWQNENKVRFLKSEEIIYSKKNDFAGIMDIEAKVNGKLAIIDIKTSSGLYNEMRYQTAGYQCAKEEMTGKKYDERWIIRLAKEDKKDYKGDVKESAGDFFAYRIDDYRKDLPAFLGLLAVKCREKELENEK